MASEASDSPAAIPEGHSEDTATVAWEEQGWNGHSEDSNASHTQNSDQHQEPTISVDPAPNSASSGDPVSDDEDAGEYDPESVTFTTTAPISVATVTAPTPPVEPESEPEPPRPSKKPKTAGGFLVGSSDDEDEDTPTPAPDATLKPVPAPIQAQPFSPSPLQQSTTTQDLPVPALVSNDQNATNSAATAASIIQPFTDYTGNLEDRVKEDPRGAVNAWLDLVREHRSRNRIDDARAVYERFFKIFPQAVRFRIIS